ncbi:hypothetical protein QTN47_03635 [Danxiaibacter flavus]|uniref:Lipoprotein n=1 Tax=Danxiaibacter flavus TaxID=3049108 RepID=A0ABV3ZDT1_9BACT|nr:hypothetical protein QNM32_03635 [Chitinophagaceae bacterium DXS]
MKRTKIVVLTVSMISGFILFFACSKRDNKDLFEGLNSNGNLEYYRSILNSNKLSGKEFYLVLNKYEKLVRDSLIQASKSENTHENDRVLENSLQYVTTLKYCSTSGVMTGAGNGILLQTGSNSSGSIQASAFAISGSHGTISQVGSLEQGSNFQGVSTVRFYLQGDFSTSSTINGGYNTTIGTSNTSVGATAGYSSTSSGYQSNIYVVTANMQSGCPVALSAVILPPGTSIEPLP